MADSKLRLQIVTALDNAGIKATQEQINGLERDLTKFSKNAKPALSSPFKGADEGVNKLANNMKTLMKDAAIAIGALKLIGTTMTDVYEQMVVEGKSFSDSMGSLFTGIGEKLRKMFFGTNVTEQIQAISKEVSESAREQIKSIDQVEEALDSQRSKINQVTATYFQQATSVQKLRQSKDNAELLGMEHTKFLKVDAARQQYGEEAAEQVGLAYDYMIEKVRQQQNVDAIDTEIAKMEKKAEAEMQKTDAFKQRIQKVDTAERFAKKMYDSVDQEIAIALDAAGDSISEEKKVEIANDIRKSRKDAWLKASKKKEKMYDQYNQQLASEQMAEVDLARMEQERANLLSNASFALDTKAQSLDKSMMEKGDWLQIPDFIGSESKFLDELYKNTNEYSERIAENTENLASMLENLLQLKN